MVTMSHNKIRLLSIVIFAALLLPSARLSAQKKISFGIFADPVISWFSSDTRETRNDGARAGFNFGFTFNRYFAENYAFSTGINILSAGGRLVNSETITMTFNNITAEVLAGNPVTYKIQYLGIPVGLKFKSNQIGYITIFSDIGIDPKVVIGGKADIPSLSIEKEAAMKELSRFNLSYHVMAGIEYSLGGSTAMVFGLGFENNFLDVTRDINNQPDDKIKLKILKFRIGVNF
jgi:hypothetical protein